MSNTAHIACQGWKEFKIMNHGYEPQSKLRGIKLSASRDCSTYQFRCASLSELEFQQ